MFMKLIPLVLEMVMGKGFAQAGQGALARLSMIAVRKAILLLTLLSVAVVFFASGLMTVILDLVMTSRDAHELMLSPVSGVGFGLMVLSLLTMAIGFRKSLWNTSILEYPHEKPAPLNDALAELVRDFVEERKFVRQTAMNEAMNSVRRSEASSSAGAAPESTSYKAYDSAGSGSSSVIMKL